MESLEGKVCIVTGASSGIGEATSILLAQRKASVVLCGRSESRLNASLEQCVQTSGGSRDRFLTVLGDLNEASVRRSIVDKTVDKFGRIDVLVCNAGMIGTLASVSDTSEELYDSLMNTNVKAVFFLIQAAVPHLEASQGCVLNVSSVLSHETAPAIIYCAAKAALDHMSRSLAVVLGPKGIRVNTVNPTFVKTRMLRDVIPSLETSTDLTEADKVLDTKAPLHPLGGRIATTEDIANAICFLISDKASFITGQSLDVDGGVSKVCPLLK